MSRFAAIGADIAATKPQSTEPPAISPVLAQRSATTRPSRAGKKGVLGHFSPELSRTLNIMAIEEGTSVQALMGEAFDLLMRARGKHPFGER
jgi:hypothetical protein